MAKRHKSVTDLVRDVGGDASFQARLEDELAKKTLAKILFAMRCAGGVTQEEMAKRLGCSQSKISKIEHSEDTDLQLGDLIDYAKALDVQMSLAFHKHMNSVESVEYHALRMKEHLDRLATLASRDDQILEGVARFFNETLVNLLNLFSQSAAKLKESKHGAKEPFEVTASPELLVSGKSSGR